MDENRKSVLDIDDDLELEYVDLEENDFEKYEEEQKEESAYFQKKEERINKTKEKLQALLEKLQAKPPKETVAKKILRLKINRLRTQLNRSIRRFDIEYSADLEENKMYDIYSEEYKEIKSKMASAESKKDILEERESVLAYELELYTKKENYKGSKKTTDKLEKMAPKGRKGSERQEGKTIAKPRTTRMQEIQKELKDVRGKIDVIRNQLAELNSELEGKLAGYKEYKVDLKGKTQEEVKGAMKELKEQEKQSKKQQKEELALTQPSIWTKIMGKVKNAMEKISAWNEKRKQESTAKSQKKDSFVLEESRKTLNTTKSSQQFREENKMNPILQMYIEASQEEWFNEKEFVQGLVDSQKFQYQDLKEGIAEIDRYVTEQEERKSRAAQVEEMLKEDEPITLIDTEEDQR